MNELRKVPPVIVCIVPIPVKLKYNKQWIDGDNLTGDGLSHWPQFVIELANERLRGIEGKRQGASAVTLRRTTWDDFFLFFHFSAGDLGNSAVGGLSYPM